MTESSMVNSPSKILSQEPLSDFKKHTRDIGSMLLRQMDYKDEGLCKKDKGVVIPIVAQQRPKYEGIKFSGQEVRTSSTQTTFVKARGTGKEAIAIEEKAIEKRVCSRPSNQTSNHHHKPKRYGMVSLVCFYCKKKGHIGSNVRHSRRPSSPCRNYNVNVADSLDIRRPNVGDFIQNSIPRTK
jgi:putative hemolysin